MTGADELRFALIVLATAALTLLPAILLVVTMVMKEGRLWTRAEERRLDAERELLRERRGRPTVGFRAGP